MSYRLFYHWITLTLLLAMIVVVAGAYTRLTDAGLGCPDWPGCYGQLRPPAALSPTQFSKASTEMFHRYLASTLGGSVLVLFLLAVYQYYRKRQCAILPLVLLLLVLFQAILGMWTVTWQLLPLVVLAHLLGGMTILAGLWWLKLSYPLKKFTTTTAYPLQSRLKPWLIAGVLVIGGQITLGGWVSANYAGVACAGFPKCNGQLIPKMNIQQALHPAAAIGPNYEGGHLDNQSRVTIQVLHRLGAWVTLFYLGTLSVIISLTIRPLRLSASIVLAVLGTQFILGIINVIAYLPLAVAVAHNATAALLLISWLTLIHKNRQISCNVRSHAS